MPELMVGISKVNKYAARDSGDTVEVVERPSGGLSVVIADAQGSGPAAKMLSNLVTSKAVALLKEGVRDSAVHEAVHDHLYHYKHGRVLCTLTTLTVDTHRRVCSLAQNSSNPAYWAQDQNVTSLGGGSEPLGVVAGLSAVLTEFPLRTGVWMVAVTDGVAMAGSRSGPAFDVERQLLRLLVEAAQPSAVAECLLEGAVQCDEGRPRDDMSVVVVGIFAGEPNGWRRMSVQVPIREDSLEKE